MHILDWLILGAYMAGIIAMSLYLGRRQHSPDDYFLAGRRMKGWPIALSIMATQVSAVSLIGAPAFVALKPGGGLRWLQYELAVPLAMIALILVFVPRLRSLPITTLYDYLEMRFGARTRIALSLVFLVSRGLSTAVAMYAASLVLSVCLGLSLVWTMMVLASITILYTTIGGIEADIYSDIVQMFVLAGGTAVALAVAILRVETTGAWQVAWRGLDPHRLEIINGSSLGLRGGETFGFWPMVIGGFFLYVSYYGCDQGQAQRLLTSKNEQESSRGLFLNGLLRFPFTLLYCLFGVVLAVFLTEHPDFAARVPAQHPDYLVPMFVLQYMPTGVIGLVMAAIFAASMSSFDSAFNSMSAVTARNIAWQEARDETCGRLRGFDHRAFASLYRCMGRVVHRRRLCDEPDAADRDRADQHDRIGVLRTDARRVCARPAVEACRRIRCALGTCGRRGDQPGALAVCSGRVLAVVECHRPGGLSSGRQFDREGSPYRPANRCKLPRVRSCADGR